MNNLDDVNSVAHSNQEFFKALIAFNNALKLSTLDYVVGTVPYQETDTTVYPTMWFGEGNSEKVMDHFSFAFRIITPTFYKNPDGSLDVHKKFRYHKFEYFIYFLSGDRTLFINSHDGDHQSAVFDYALDSVSAVEFSCTHDGMVPSFLRTYNFNSGMSNENTAHSIVELFEDLFNNPDNYMDV